MPPLRILGAHEDYELVPVDRPTASPGPRWDRRSAAEFLRRLPTSPAQHRLLQRLGPGTTLARLAEHLAAGTLQLRPRTRRHDQRADVDDSGTMIDLAALAAR